MSAVQLVRLKQGKSTFEVMVKPGCMKEYKEGKLSINNVIETDVIFKNQSKGEKANTADLENVFETSDTMACIKLILERGDVQLSQGERKEKVDKKRSEIVNYIHKYYVDPQTKLPHPVARINLALDEIKARIDGETPGERQAQDIIKKLPGVLTLKKCEILGTLKVPNKHMGSAGGAIAQYVTILNDKWDGEGCSMEVSLVPGDFDKFVAEMDRFTKGEYTFNVEGNERVEAPAEKGNGKRKGKKGKKRG